MERIYVKVLIIPIPIGILDSEVIDVRRIVSTNC